VKVKPLIDEGGVILNKHFFILFKGELFIFSKQQPRVLARSYSKKQINITIIRYHHVFGYYCLFLCYGGCKLFYALIRVVMKVNVIWFLDELMRFLIVVDKPESHQQ
jgi:hypothetical protein